MIEQLITELIAALKENTAVHLTAPTVAATPAKAAKAKPTPEPAATVVAETPAPAEEPAATPEPEPAEVEAVAFPKDPTAARLFLSDAVKAKFNAAKPDQLTLMKTAFENLRAKWGITKTPELKDDQIEPFYNEAMEAIKLD